MIIQGCNYNMCKYNALFKDKGTNTYTLKINRHKNKDLVIIGNGFDLSVGLESSLSQFLNNFSKLNISLYKFIHEYLPSIKNKMENEYYNGNSMTVDLLMKYIDGITIDPPTNSQTSALSMFDNDHGKLHSKRKNSHKDLTDSQMSSLAERFISHINNIEINNKNMNFWVLYFLLQENDNISFWSDVEKEIYKFLDPEKSQCYQFIYILAHILNINISNPRVAQNRDNSFGTFNNYFIGFLFLHGFKYKVNNSLIFNHISICNWGHKTFEDLYNCVFKFLKLQLLDFEKYLNDYLIKCVNDYKTIFGISYYYIGGKLLKALTSNDVFNLLNFNYTNPSKDINQLLKYRRNIHGVLMDKRYNPRKAPIIGISDDNININHTEYEFTKNYRIMRLSCNKYSNILNSNIDCVKFFGHSFDSADYAYFFDIFNHYKIDKQNNVKWIFYYIPHNGENDDSSAKKQINKVNNLIYKYYLYKLRNKFLASNYAKHLIYILSFEGRLIISNLQDSINNDPRFDIKFDDINYIKDVLYNMNKIKSNLDKDKTNLNELKQNFNALKQGIINAVKYSYNNNVYKKYSSLLKIFDNYKDKTKGSIISCCKRILSHFNLS